MPSIFSLMNPANGYQVWFTIYLYCLPLLLWAAWASLSLIDLGESTEGSCRAGWAAFIILVPLLGGACYLLGAARTLRRSPRVAIVVTGLLVWLPPLIYGVWWASGPLGPKALT